MQHIINVRETACAPVFLCPLVAKGCMSLTEVSAQRDAAFRVVDGGQHVAEPLRRHALVEALPVAALRQDVHAV